jgi:hypothetical protein
VFVDAIASTYERTRNSWITESIREHGTLGAARADFQDYQRLDFEPDWWELAYTESGALAGVIRAKPDKCRSSPISPGMSLVVQERSKNSLFLGLTTRIGTFPVKFAVPHPHQGCDLAEFETPLRAAPARLRPPLSAGMRRQRRPPG